ncbi:8706_t:CDS:1 [Paraglomus occultum]|uniref:8706_t:CDS:1 n=1 Tax=Paraglomus occultum TaxID=144539 RepID=A0A9N9A033_9GLOM|nr:8706_t:CDS:1 [Paraglomus occultum]
MSMHSDELSSLSNGNFATNQIPMAACLELSDLTCDDKMLLLYPPYYLFAPLESLLDPMRKKYARKNAPPPRPRNSWLIFRKNFESLLRNFCSNQPFTIQEISKLASEHWKEQSKLVKRYFKVLSKLAYHIHRNAYPDYTYRPRKAKHIRQKKLVFKKIDTDTILKTRFYKNDTKGEKDVYENFGIDDAGSNENEDSNKLEFIYNDNCYANSSQTSNDNAVSFNTQCIPNNFFTHNNTVNQMFSPEEFNLVNYINDLFLNHYSTHLSTHCISQNSPFVLFL